MTTNGADPLGRFSALTREWFTTAFAAPTPAQADAWSAISEGNNTLVIAPTGSGKTLAAFLWAIDRLADPAREPSQGTQVLYVSPLKALAVDVERNLRTPLTGITRVAERHGLPAPSITVGVRSGDTPPNQRRAMIANPPDVLITTPESLFLMLTSAARETLTSVRTVIVDEVHAVAATKRGAHLALSLERLDQLLDTPAQRIGLSATVRPPEEVARFLSGQAPTTIVCPPAAKTFDLSVQVPVPDMANLDNNSIWPDVEERIVDLVEAHNSSIVFANSRRLAERLTSRLNEIHAERSGIELPAGPNPEVGGGAPAHLMGSGQANGAPPLLARAHHGSVSKEQRAQVEDDLKSGRLRAVVATSSLELGIDMGAVDLVIQVEAPPSVASGLQRVGRAGHQVGEISQGVLFPKHRTDLIGCAVTVQRMQTGDIETLRVPANPLDVLAQHTVAVAALEPVDADAWFDAVRRSAPFATLPRSAFEATLDLLSGKYPSTEFAELRPRLVYDRDTGTLTARPGAQRLAVTSGGAIPDRGMFTVYLASETEKPSRVGELDEEMVYESRPGDVISLGATSWRITEITHDRVLVIPAPGQPARLPFWRGDSVGRPAELGAAVGAFTGELASLDRKAFDKRCQKMGFAGYATDNLHQLLREQREATGVVPSDTTFVVERFRDELGDWRVILHSPYGLRVHGPLALAVGRRLRERYGIDEKPTASDDGIIVRLPDSGDTPPGADLFVFDADEIEPIVTAEVGGSALFASRFRECAARALLLPRRHPGKRSPLWHQRQRAAQLLDIARKYPDFPIVLEAVRECLQDVYDVPALIELMHKIAQRRLRIVEVETATPSPFAASLLFGYVGAFMYEGDSPLAERRAAALALDTVLLSELLGRVELRELLDPAVVASTSAQLQHLTPERAARDAEGVADLLRLLGPLTEADIAQRCTADNIGAWLDGLHAAKRALPVTYAGQTWWAAVEDIGLLRDGIGVPVPVGVPAAFTESASDPLGDLIGRYARTRGPFTTEQTAARFGLGVRVASDVLSRMAVDGRLIRGEFAADLSGEQWCDAQVLKILRRRSLAALRAQVEPVSTDAYARFLPSWQHVGSTNTTGIDGLATVIEQLAGVPIPASAVESLVFPQRVRDYQPAMLDELLASGEVMWSGAGQIGNGDGWVAFHLADTAPLTLTHGAEIEFTDTHRVILETLGHGGAYFFRQLTDGTVEGTAGQELKQALWELIWAGWVTGDTFAPVRAVLSGPRRSGAPAHRQRQRPPRLSRYSVAHAQTRGTDPTVSGRWSALPAAEPDSTVRAHFQAELLLGRHGVLTKGAVGAEGVPGGFATLYKVLSTFEDAGRCQRGYFVESLGGAQFAVASTVDRLRSYLDNVDPERPEYHAVVLAATDPANPYGAALGWPTDSEAHRPGRKAGALVALVDGRLVWFLERGGRSLLSFGADADAQRAAAGALTDLVSAGRIPSLLVERINGVAVLDPDVDAERAVVQDALLGAGLSRTPRGLRLR
ncbi:ATP-dependent helicase [Mycolicibacterium smegmatis]|uniref:Lhr helicase/ probable uracil glycosylase n=2 Tax=Mycolicibacterium smegmatis TaxID=1772 RepID=LHR_MYCS2|nr:ATP-dependent helicase [Mycolicibacterium smegmatis]ABK70223.1 DEAD/DEAH box helicase [Mycolicibacterium smegmatis MC2 155]AFP38187.1 ATP-dependent DNA helicase [Mycolicibacterium smegmatis MC2 155]AIU06981.1 ATP-dependent helicase [Mycolicibacterium smegmatis MC2 155]AIU13606.1 ATP-dependent helicase [Mycolicibacterium smegmatis]AIU20230.1 ATP-dependent helicase [Mycolicibacterium smegmatis]